MLQRTDEISVRVGPYDLSEDCLPDRPSALIRVALADLERTLLNPDYRFEFSSFHWLCLDGKCDVCLAGGILAQSVGAGPEKDVSCASGCQRTCEKLYALSYFAAGNVEEGFSEMGVANAAGWENRGHNTSDLDVLIPQLETLANDLESAWL